MDEATKEMLEEAYRDTAEESVARGIPLEKAHQEALVAAAMFLSAIKGVENQAARQQVAVLGFKIK
jgi:hypothetical protein